MKIKSAAVFIILSLFPFYVLSAGADRSPPEPRVSAESAVLIEADTNEIIYKLNDEKRLPMASTTKIMTSLIALENGDLDEEFSIPADAVGVEGSSVYLKEGETVTLRDLLFALMLESANDAAAAIAYRIGGDVERFSELMNKKAQELGLENTHFTNPHGLDDKDHFTTSYDLAKLTCIALANEEFERIVSTRETDAFLCGTPRKLVNHNRLLNSLDGAIGVKTGFTRRSGRCLVSAVKRDGVLTVAVTLNDPNDWSDHRSLHEYGQSLYKRRKLTEPGSISVDIPVIGGEKSKVRCSCDDTLLVVLKNKEKTKLTVEAPRFVPAPVRRGDAIGKVVFCVHGKTVGSAPLYAESDVAEKRAKQSFFEKILELLGKAN